MATKYRIPKLDTIQGGINAFDDLADTIANPPAGRPLRQAIGQAGRAYCDFVGSQPGQAIVSWTGQGLVAPLLCKPYWDSEGYDAPVPGDPPFTGGQCEGVNYNVRVEILSQTTGEWGGITNLGNCFGPISAITVVSTGQFTSRLTVFCRTSSGAPNERIYNAGVKADRLRAGAITVIGGGDPNLCGDPPGGGFEPGENPPPTPTFPPGEGPGTEPDGQPFFFVPPIPNPIGGDPIDVPPQPDPDPTDPGSPGDDTPTNPGEPGDPEETGAGGESSGCAPAGSELTGVFVEIVDFPENAARFQNNSRQPFRGAGYIAMGWPDLLGVDVSGGVINLEQFFHAQQRGVTCWRVTANTGFDLQCTPYYRELNPEEEEE